MNNWREMGEWSLRHFRCHEEQLFYYKCNYFEFRLKSTVCKIIGCLLEEYFCISEVMFLQYAKTLKIAVSSFITEVPIV